MPPGPTPTAPPPPGLTPTPQTECRGCGHDCGDRYHWCDRDIEDRALCDDCFAKTPCGAGEHGIGCHTLVIKGRATPC